MNFQKIIQKLGYSSTEVKVYLAALQLGSATISEIAQKAGIPRTTVQEVVTTLRQDGLMNPITRLNRKYWVAENPNKLLLSLEENKVALQSALPELQALRYDAGIKPTVKVFSGKEEISKVFDDILESKRHVLSIVSWEDWIELMGEEFVNDFIQQRVRHFLKIKLLTPRTNTAVALRRRDDQELRTTCFMPDDSKITTSNFIYGDKVAIISLNRKMPVGTIIEDHDIAETMTVLFEAMWQKSNNRND